MSFVHSGRSMDIKDLLLDAYEPAALNRSCLSHDFRLQAEFSTEGSTLPGTLLRNVLVFVRA